MTFEEYKLACEESNKRQNEEILRNTIILEMIRNHNSPYYNDYYIAYGLNGRDVDNDDYKILLTDKEHNVIIDIYFERLSDIEQRLTRFRERLIDMNDLESMYNKAKSVRDRMDLLKIEVNELGKYYSMYTNYDRVTAIGSMDECELIMATPTRIR